jgi:putative DNA primase/helicase
MPSVHPHSIQSGLRPRQPALTGNGELSCFHRYAKAGSRAEGRDADDAASLTLPPPGNPMQTAREFIARHCLHAGTLILHYWRDSWWEWATTRWREVERRFVLSRLYTFTEHAVYWDEAENGYKPWAPNRHRIGDLAEALGAICILRDDIDQPCWLDGSQSKGVIVACANGLLELEKRELRPHSPLFFNLVAVPFPYDPNAPSPAEWLGFLQKLWPGDNPDAEPALDQPEFHALGEWFGYVISGRLDLHKILLMIGPTRGGKGIIARILSALIGPANVAGPTLSSLGGEFGLAPLIGKALAIVADARFAGRDSAIVVERLLSISGEDTLTVNRKYRDQWTGKLPCRLHVLSNEMPKLGDASAAIIGRMVLLVLTHSWLGKEDFTLEERIQKELPGILNWALDGLHRLTVKNGNRFTRLPSAEESIAQMRDLASPIGAFVREECDVQAGYEIEVDMLYGAFKVWAENNGHTKSSKQVFGRDLHAAVAPKASAAWHRKAPARLFRNPPKTPRHGARRRQASRSGRSRLHGPRTMSCLLYDRVRRVHNTSRGMLNASETHGCERKIHVTHAMHAVTKQVVRRWKETKKEWVSRPQSKR